MTTYNEKMHAERDIKGEYKDLFVSAGDRRRGRTHCRICGGRTRERDKDGQSAHQACTGEKKGRRKKK